MAQLKHEFNIHKKIVLWFKGNEDYFNDWTFSFLLKMTLKWKRLWNTHWKLKRLDSYSTLITLVWGFSNTALAIKWWILDEELYWRLNLGDEREVLTWDLSLRTQWQDGLKWNLWVWASKLNLSPFIIISEKRKRMLALGSNLRLRGTQNNFRCLVLIINAYSTVEDFFPWKMTTYLPISHTGSLVTRDRKMQARVRLPGLTYPLLCSHKFKEWRQKRDRRRDAEFEKPIHNTKICDLGELHLDQWQFWLPPFSY